MKTKFSKTHYEAIAEVLRVRKPKEGSWQLSVAHFPTVVQEFEDMFVRDNPRFDVEKFRRACGIIN